MENTYLQQVLKVFTKTEWKTFGDYVSSPYFNKNDKFVRLYKLLNPYFPNFALQDAEKETIYISTTLSDTYNDAGYRNLCSDFLLLALDFLAQESLKTGNTIKDQYLNRTLITRNVLDLAEKNIKKVQTAVAKGELGLREQLLTNIWINDLQILHNIYRNRKSMHASNQIMLEDNTSKYIAEWALVRSFTALMNNNKAKRTYNIPPDLTKINALFGLYEALEPFDHKETSVIYLIMKMHVEEDGDSYYYAALSIVKSFDFTKDIATNENILIGFLDYADKKVLIDEKWRQELYELYNIKLTNHLWNMMKGLSYASLFNAIMNALQMGKIEYAENILNKYIHEVSDNIKESIFNLCSAWIQFFKGNFEESHAYLTLVVTENMMIKYEMRSLQCFIYLQKAEWDILNAALESFRQFIAYNKNNIESTVTELFTIICKNIAALAKLHPDYKEKDKEKLIAALHNEKISYMRKWMLEKISNSK